MFNIASYLHKFSKNIESAEIDNNGICGVISKHTDLTVTSDNIEIKNYTLYLDISPTFKNKLFMKKRAILDDYALLYPSRILDIK